MLGAVRGENCRVTFGMAAPLLSLQKDALDSPQAFSSPNGLPRASAR